MKSRESEAASQIRLQQWAEEIRDCRNRPANMTVDEWCLQHGMKKASYYWRLKRVRQACLDTLEQSAGTFTELPVPKEDTMPVVTNHDFKTGYSGSTIMAVLRTENGATIEITEHASAEFMKLLMGVISHAE